MKKIFGFFFFSFLLTIYGQAQNPISYSKDTVLSAPELNFEILWHTFEDNRASTQPNLYHDGKNTCHTLLAP